MYFIRLMAFLWEREESPNVHLPTLLLPVKGKPLFSTGHFLSREDAFPIGCMGDREIIIINYDVQNLVSPCLYKHQIISSVPALKPPQGYFLSVYFSAALITSEHTSSSQRHGLFREPTLLEILLATELQYATGKNKKTLIFSFP